MTDALDTNPPEMTDKTIEDPMVLGYLTEQENNALGMLRRQGQQIQMQIGEMEVAKARLLGNMAELENHAQRVLNEAGKRLSVPEGQPWTVTADGIMRMVPGGKAG
jgi:hypothetical protein